MALTRENLVRSGGRDGTSMPVLDTEQQYAGGLVGLDAAGRCRKWRDNVADKWLGVGQKNALGDTLGTVEQRIDLEGARRYEVVVTGVVGEANVGDNVYCADDGPTYKLAAGVTVIATIIRWHSGEVCDIVLKPAAI